MCIRNACISQATGDLRTWMMHAVGKDNRKSSAHPTHQMDHYPHTTFASSSMFFT